MMLLQALKLCIMETERAMAMVQLPILNLLPCPLNLVLKIEIKRGPSEPVTAMNVDSAHKLVSKWMVGSLQVAPIIPEAADGGILFPFARGVPP